MDYIASELSYLDGIFTHPRNQAIFKDKVKTEIQTELSRRWRSEDRAALLEDLSARFGQDTVLETVDAIVRTNCRQDWEENGRKSKEGNSLDVFLKELWEPLRGLGFQFTSRRSGSSVQFTVTRCPLAEEGRARGIGTWLYHLACLTDEPSVTGFNPRVKFTRTQTLMQGHPVCDHCYTEEG